MNRIQKLVDERNELAAGITYVRSALDAEDIADDDFTAGVDYCRTGTDELAELDRRIDSLEQISRTAADPRNVDAAIPAPVTVRSEPEVYSARSEHSFFADVVHSERGDFAARDRLERHQRANADLETRDTATSAFGALVVPQYLTDLFAENLRAGRPFLNAVTSVPLPSEGMTINVPRGTTATTVAAQASENAGVSETDFDETTLTVNVRTFAGQQDVSRQALDRGRGIDSILYADLAADYAAKVDRSALADDGTGGTHLGVLSTSGINSVTYTDATPTVAEIMPKVADAIQRINGLRFQPASLIVMHPRRWGWFLSAVDGQQRPLVLPAANMPQNAQGVGSQGYDVVGQLMGVPVITDGNVPTNLGAGTNQDPIIVCRREDILIMEESAAPRQFEAEQTAAGNLTVKLGVFGYSAFTAGRYPVSVSVVNGTGLIAPTF